VKVVIVGGGIGGMALALALHAAGISDLDVYESASSVKELGVGINVLPHAVPSSPSSETLQVIEDRAPSGFTNLEDVISPQELDEIVTAYHRTAGFDPAILNERPSYSVR